MNFREVFSIPSLVLKLASLKNIGVYKQENYPKMIINNIFVTTELASIQD